ncbi:MAG TPA: nuclear transport factor 2 family protein [Gemmatimonadales bacterium]|nr:nuclear transport factor 2 family protein [Gemmatimonadales bacterium]
MQTLRLLGILVAVASPLAAQGPSPDADAIKAELDSTAAGWNRNDIGRYMAAYDTSMRSMTRNGPVGLAATETAIKNAFWKDGKANQQLRYEEVDVRKLGADFAVCTGHFILSGGGLKDIGGWFSTVWMRTPTGWRMILDHS